MARTIEEIKTSLTQQFLQNKIIQEKFSLSPTKSFSDQFSQASLVSIFFYVVAFAIYTLEFLFDTHKQEITIMIDELQPGTLRWLVNAAKAYMYGYELVEGTDKYDTSKLTDGEIAAALVVKQAAATEANAIVSLKVAGANLTPLTKEQEVGLTSYIEEIKYAGVVINIINREADHFKAKLKIWYSPQKINSAGASIIVGGEPVREAIIGFLATLPFNSECRLDKLIDAVQAIEGIEIVELLNAETSVNAISWNVIDGYSVPEAGYYKVYDEADLDIEYVPYQPTIA